MWQTIRHRLDQALASIMTAVGWLVLPIGVLLFLQWPLRDLLRAWSQKANDLAQWLFALYVAVALTQATRTRMHLAIAGFSRRFTPRTCDKIGRIGIALGLLPWAALVLVVGSPSVWQSLRQLERFSDTTNPGYFLIKFSALLLAVLMLAQGLCDLTRKRIR